MTLSSVVISLQMGGAIVIGFLFLTNSDGR